MKKRAIIAAEFAIFDAKERNIEGVKVLLIYPPVRLNQQPLYPPFGLLSIASVLEKAGAIVEILDLNMLRLSFDELKKELSGREFDIMGTGGMATVYYYMKYLAEYFKHAYPHIPIISGGTASSGSAEVIMEKTKFDLTVIGEGEPVIIDVVDALINEKSLAAIPGIMFRNDEGIAIKTIARPRMLNLEELPLPAYHLIDMEMYITNALIYKNKKNPVSESRIKTLGLDREKAERPIMIFSKRGCPFGCNFCYRNFGRKVVGMSVQHTLDHMSFLEKTYNTINFVFGDEIFNVDRKWVMEFCDAIIEEKRNYVLNVGNGLRANVVDKEMMEKMKEAGFCSVAVGIESFYSPTLKEMNKGQSREVIANAIRDIKGSGFHLASAQFLFGYTSDGPESMKTNVGMCKELGLKNASFAIPCPYPGTYLYDKAIEAGYIEDEEEWLMELSDKDISDRVINMSGRPVEELQSLITAGEDEIRMYFIRKDYYILGYILTVLQKIFRVFDLSAFNIIKGLKDAIINLLFYGRLPETLLRSGGASDVIIKDEVFEILKQWDAEKELKTDISKVKVSSQVV